LSVFTRSSQSSTKNGKPAAENITKEEIERLVAKHKVKMLSMPVRAEFLNKTPLTTKDLESIDIRVYHRKPGMKIEHEKFVINLNKLNNFD
jgi:hypothetical protein